MHSYKKKNTALTIPVKLFLVGHADAWSGCAEYLQHVEKVASALKLSSEMVDVSRRPSFAVQFRISEVPTIILFRTDSGVPAMVRRGTALPNVVHRELSATLHKIENLRNP